MKGIDYFTEAVNALSKAESQLIVANGALRDLGGFPESRLMELVELRNQIMAFRKKLDKDFEWSEGQLVRRG